MDFLERFFNAAPDGGSGYLEASILVAVGLFITVAIVIRCMRRSRPRKPSLGEA